MRKGLLSFLLIVVALATGSAQADSVRVPKTGDPAFAFAVPAGWTIFYDEYGNLRLTALDHSCALQLSMISDASVGKASLPQLAAQIMQAAQAKPFTKKQAAQVAGRNGTEFFSKITNDKGVVIELRVILVRLDASHVASQVAMKGDGITKAERAALDNLIAQVRLTAVK